MWEISSGKSPLWSCNENNKRNETKDTPLDYEKLMEQCWNASPSKRPDSDTLFDKVDEINISDCQYFWKSARTKE